MSGSPYLMLDHHWMIGWMSGSNRHKGAAPETNVYHHARSFKTVKLVLGVGENSPSPQVSDYHDHSAG